MRFLRWQLQCKVGAALDHHTKAERGIKRNTAGVYEDSWASWASWANDSNYQKMTRDAYPHHYGVLRTQDIIVHGRLHQGQELCG